MRDHYDFSKAVRGNHAARYAEGVQVIVDGEEQAPKIAILEPDVAAAFPDSESVNRALRVLLKAAKELQGFKKAS